MPEPTDLGLGQEEIVLRGERVALFEVLARSPVQLRLDDLIMRLTRFQDAPGKGEVEDIKECISELVGFGLLYRHDDLVLPTPAALHMDLLLKEGE